PGEQAPAPLPAGGGRRPPETGTERDAKLERDPASRPGTARKDPARRVVDPGLTWRRCGSRRSSSRLALSLNPGRALAGGVELARRAEALGYDSAWVTHGSGRDSFVVLAAYGAATTKLGLGHGVVPIYPRHPVAMAQAALTLSELSAGRFRLGIGVSHRVSMETALGLTLREALALLREYVAVLRRPRGVSPACEVRHYKVNWTVDLPERPPTPPIYLASLSKKMLELAGEIADGVVLWLCSPAYVRDGAVPGLGRGR